MIYVYTAVYASGGELEKIVSNLWNIQQDTTRYVGILAFELRVEFSRVRSSQAHGKGIAKKVSKVS